MENKKSLTNGLDNNKGFTLTEILVTVGILAILITMAFPDIISFFKMQQERQETEDLRQIQLALEAYSKDRRILPPVDGNGTTTDSWAEELASFTSLPVENMLFDRWNAPRHYKTFSVTDTFRDAVVDVHYALVYSYGSTRAVDTDVMDSDVLADLEPADAADPLGEFPCDPGPCDIATSEAADSVTIYSDLRTGNGDDQFTKYTDRQVKIENYETTMDRIGKISEALEVYSRASLNAAIVANEANRENKIFYPPSDPGGGVADAAAYGDTPIADAGTYLGGVGNRFDTSADDAARRTDMTALMRLLGLPDAYCCNAMTNQPFYYFSNPRPRLGGGACGARPTGPGAGTPFLPPRVLVDTDADTCG